MARFDYLEARSTDEVFEILAKYGADARVIAGGTDLLMNIRRKKIAPKMLVGITQIPELQGVRPEGDGLWLGAATTHHSVTAAPLVWERFPLLAAASGKVGSRQIRNMATIGGNVCNAAPCADTAPALLALGAEAEILGPSGPRRLPIEAFFIGPSRSALTSDELLVGLSIPATWRGAGSAYHKHAWRDALDIQMCGAAVALRAEPGGRCVESRIALGTAAPTPVRACQAEEALHGQLIDEDLAQYIGAVAAAEARPRTSYRSTEDYRREMLEILVQRALLDALDELE
jgi:carbon-monoxide dehydrogenase medium subunit